ncbi:hypothetical protein GCM10026982_51970 [Nocardiopsis aegyptia]
MTPRSATEAAPGYTAPTRLVRARPAARSVEKPDHGRHDRRRAVQCRVPRSERVRAGAQSGRSARMSARETAARLARQAS